jgi:hypothetical protein
MLLAGRETTGMSLENMYSMHLDSADKQALYREKRGCDPCKNTFCPQRQAARKGFVMHAAEMR